jgi:hypothetical protein
MAKTSEQDPFAELVGKKCQLVTQGTTASALVFSWSAISERRRAAFLEDLFGDWSPGEAPLGLVAGWHLLSGSWA